MEAIILAGGRGTRLAAVVPDLPKPMAPVNGLPFLSYLLDALSAKGFTRIVLSVGYKAEAIVDRFGSSYAGLEIAYCVEETPLGTGGGIRKALTVAHEPEVFVLNGDTFATIDYAAMSQSYRLAGSRLTLALMPVPDTARYGAIEVSEGRITAFREKGQAGPGYINAGVYLLPKTLFSELAPPPLPDQFSFEEEILTKRFAEVVPRAYLGSGYFIDIGVPEDYARAQIEMPALLKEFAHSHTGHQIAG